MDRCSTWVHPGGALPITLMVLQEIIGLPMILVEAIGLTKRRMLLIHMETFLFDLENIKDAVVNEINGINKKFNITLKFKPADDSQFKFSVL